MPPMENNSDSLVPRTFKGIWIPREIWLDRRLTYFEKCLLSEIHSLDDPEKGCYASNQYFMSFFNEKERKIQDGLAKLKQFGYVIQEKFDGRVRTLRTNLFSVNSLFSTSEVQGNIPKNSDKSLFSTSGVSNFTPLPCEIPHLSPIGDSIEPENKAYNKDKKEKHPPSPPEGGNARVACGAFVKLTTEEREALEKFYGAQRVEGLIEEINDYLASTGKKPYKDYAAVVRQWARRRGFPQVIEDPKDSMPSMIPEKKVDSNAFIRDPKAQSDYEWLEKIRRLNPPFGNLFRQFPFVVKQTDTYIQFLDLPEAKHFFGEDGFRSMVDSSCRKLNLVLAS